MKASILVSAIVPFALSAPIVAAQEGPTPAKPPMDMDMSQAQEKMKAMQAQMDKIHKTTDAKERQKLMQEHMQAMQESMKAMRGMGGPMMMGGKKGAMTDGDMMKRGDMTEKRMDMMQMMMEQMMQHDQMTESMPPKDGIHAPQMTANFDSAVD